MSQNKAFKNKENTASQKDASIPQTQEAEYVVRHMPEKFRKPNYYKYPIVIDRLVDMLDGANTAAEISKALRITQQTLFKYKALAQLENGLTLQTMEEKIHLAKNSKNGQSYTAAKREK